MKDFHCDSCELIYDLSILNPCDECEYIDDYTNWEKMEKPLKRRKLFPDYDDE